MASGDLQENMTLSATETSRAGFDPASVALTNAQLLLNEAKDHFVSDTERSLHLSQQAVNFLETLPPATNEAEASPRSLLLANCRISLANCLERQSHYEEAIAEAEKALALLEPLRREDQPVTSEFIGAYSDALHLIGNAHQRTGRNFEALNFYRSELQFLEMMGARKEQVAVRNATASVSFHLGDYAAAMESSLKALALAEETDHRQGQGSALNILGNLYFNRGDTQAALDSYERSLVVFTGLGDRYWQAGVLGNYANACLRVGKHDQALGMHCRSLRLREEIQDRQGQAHSLLNLGSLYAGKLDDSGTAPDTEKIKPALALRFYKRALRLFDRVGDRQGVASCLVRIADLYALAERLPRALRYGNAALTLAQGAGIRKHIYEAHFLLSNVHECLGDFARALEHHRQFHAVKEAVFNAENEERVRNLEVIHRVTQARQDTEAQRRLSERLAVTIKALRAADSEKAQLLVKLRQQADLLELQVRTDALTGLLNRRTLDRSLEEEWEHARQEQNCLCIAICDIDHFKQINDEFSHHVGDAVLRRIALIFRETLREADTAARYGGEEFVFLLRDTPLAKAQEICEALRIAVNTDDWEALRPGLQVSLSIGICAAQGKSLLSDSESALRSADTALYKAKRLGRNRVCVTAPPAA